MFISPVWPRESFYHQMHQKCQNIGYTNLVNEYPVKGLVLRNLVIQKLWHVKQWWAALLAPTGKQSTYVEIVGLCPWDMDAEHSYWRNLSYCGAQLMQIYLELLKSPYAIVLLVRLQNDDGWMGQLEVGGTGAASLALHHWTILEALLEALSLTLAY